MTNAIRQLVGPAGRSRLAVKLVADLIVAALAVVVAYAARFESVPSGVYGHQLVLLVLTLPWVRLVAHQVLGVYRTSWRLFGIREALQLCVAVAGPTAVLIVARVVLPFAMPDVSPVPFSVVALEGMFVLAGMIGARVLARSLDEHAQRELIRRESGQSLRRAILVGAGRAGSMAARELRNRPDAGYEVVGFLDDDPTRRGQVIEGVKVLGTTEHAAAAAAEAEAEVLILTMPSATRAEVRSIVERCGETGLPVRTVPGLYELLGGKVGITKIRPLRIEDLLGREVVGFDEESWASVESVFRGKRILVTGAGGSIGSELCRQLAALEPEQITLVEASENNLFDIDNEIRALVDDRVVACLADVRDPEAIGRIFAVHRPQVVFHAAAYKHVPMMEAHPAAAVENNVVGTKVVVDAADAYGVERFLFVSTDKAVNPANVMGASKRVAEMVVQARSTQSRTKFCCVRFGNVLGSRGSVLHTFQRQIEAGGPVTVTHPDVTRFFMTIPEAVRLVIQSAAVGEGGEVFLLEMGEPVRIMDMATEMIRLAGLSPEECPIEIVGLRPGEKLHEELLRDDEGERVSGVSGVMLAKLSAVAPNYVDALVGRLRAAADPPNPSAIRRILATSTGYSAELEHAETSRQGATGEVLAAPSDESGPADDVLAAG